MERTTATSYIQNLIDQRKTSLVDNGERLATHRAAVDSKNPMFRWLSRNADRRQAEILEDELAIAANYFESSVLCSELLDTTQNLSLTAFEEPPGYGVQWKMDQIEGNYEGKSLRLFALWSTDWTSSAQRIRTVRWAEIRGFTNGIEITQEEANTLYGKVIKPLRFRNQKDKIEIKNFPNSNQDKHGISHRGYFDRVAATK